MMGHRPLKTPGAEPPATAGSPDQGRQRKEDGEGRCRGEAFRLIYTKPLGQPAAPEDGWRVLVDASWRPVPAESSLPVDDRIEGLAPAPHLRERYSRRPEKFACFAREYTRQLESMHPHEALERLIRRQRTSAVTLVYAATDAVYEPVFVLQAFLLMLAAARSEKSRLRQWLLQKRAALPDSHRRQASQAIRQRVLALPAVSRAREVAVYLSVADEVDTWELSRRLLERGVRVYAPKIEGKTLTWGLLASHPPEGLVRGPYRGILEPPWGWPAHQVRPQVAVVPVVGFDAQGYRIGYGGGYYDRTLAQWKDAVRVGVAFECQRVHRLPREPHDLPLHWVVTESSVTPGAAPPG